MITEDYVSFETAKLLKEKGFDSLLTTCYTDEEFPVFMDCVDYLEQGELYERSYGCNCHLIQAPSLAMAMRWLREVHGIFIEVNCNCNNLELTCTISKVEEDFGDKVYENVGFYFQTYSYEEAVEAALKYCLEKLI